MQRRSFLTGLAAGLVGLLTFRKAVAAPAPVQPPAPPKVPEFYSGTWNVDYLELPPYHREVSETRRIEEVWSADGSHIVELLPVPGSERTSIYYKNAFLMFEDIRKHVAETGESILSSDDPKNGRLGFATESGTTWWGIKVLDLVKGFNKSSSLQDAWRAVLIREYIKTPEGRVKLAQALSDGSLGIKYVKPGVYC